MQGAELPDQGNERAAERQQCQRPRTTVEPDRQGRKGESKRKKAHDARGSVGNVTHLLGKADDLDLEVAVLVQRAHFLFEAIREIEVVELLARRRIGFEQIGDHHRAGIVAGDQRADVAAGDGILADTLDARVVERVGGDVPSDHILRLESLFGHPEHTGVRRPQRRDRAPVDAGQEHDRLRDVVELAQARCGPDLAVARMHDDDDAVGAENLVAELEEGADVFVTLRQLLVEAGIHVQPAREHAHHDGEQCQHRQDQPAVREQQPLQLLYAVGDHPEQPDPVLCSRSGKACMTGDNRCRSAGRPVFTGAIRSCRCGCWPHCGGRIRKRVDTGVLRQNETEPTSDR